MPALARPELEALLRSRNLDRTLTSMLPSSLPAVQPDDFVVAATRLGPLDVRLGGGFPRGQVSEIVGARSTGRTSLLLRILAAALARGELVALVDALDMLDVASAALAGIDFERLLWIRGHVVVNPGLCRDMNQRAVEQAIKALALVLQAGTFGVVVFDVAEAPPDAIRRLPFTTWLRLQRIVEGSQTACVLIGPEPMARSSAGLTLRLDLRSGIREQGSGIREQGSGHYGTRASGMGVGPHATEKLFTEKLFQGLPIEAHIVRARSRVHEETAVAFSTVVSPDA